MRKVVVGTFVTLDGVMQGPGGPDEDREGGFEHGGWNVPHWDEMMGELINEQTQASDALLIGRRTYDIFYSFWPKVDQEDPVAGHINRVAKYVASRTLEGSDWQNTTIISDLPAEVARLKEQSGGDIAVTGSSELIQTLLAHDLVDVFNIWTFPVLLGKGKKLFGEGTMPGGLKLVDTKVSTTGVTIQRFERDGDVKVGEFTLDNV
ncbi:MAG: dihydrofolate reductase family protein [Actinomycetota bacterium]